MSDNSRGMLFSGPMVRAILEGRKTQTRRIIKPLPDIQRLTRWHNHEGSATWQAIDTDGSSAFMQTRHPVESLMWVRETWALVEFPSGGDWIYRADYRPDLAENMKWRPSIFMPRAASRITLKVMGVRVQRLHEIREEDALAEGVTPMARKDTHTGELYPIICLTDPLPLKGWGPRQSYASLWESIHGPGSWAENPWVWAYTFSREKS